MTQLLTHAWKPALAAVALAGGVLVTNAAEAGHHGRQPCNPAAEAHMKTAIRLMDTSCGKPMHVQKSLARAAWTHISLAQRFVRTPGARAELSGAKATLGKIVHGRCAPPVHGAIEQTRLALEFERGLCACRQPSCQGGCHAQPPAGPHLGRGSHSPVDRGPIGSFDRRSHGPVDRGPYGPIERGSYVPVDRSPRGSAVRDPFGPERLGYDSGNFDSRYGYDNSDRDFGPPVRDSRQGWNVLAERLLNALVAN